METVKCSKRNCPKDLKKNSFFTVFSLCHCPVLVFEGVLLFSAVGMSCLFYYNLSVLSEFLEFTRAKELKAAGQSEILITEMKGYKGYL